MLLASQNVRVFGKYFFYAYHGQIVNGRLASPVLSTILWNIAFDDMLNLFKGKGIICVGYADDGCILITGKHLKGLYRDMNEALEKCRNWAEEYGLGLSPSKTNYMLFTKKSRKSYTIPQSGIKIGSDTVEKVQSCKYLGLTIDNKLKWDEHINQRITAAKRNLFRLKGFISSTVAIFDTTTSFRGTTSAMLPAMMRLLL